MVNLSSFIRFHATRSPNRLALIYEGQRISYAQFYQRILHMAAYLRAEGIGEQDVVAVFMKNSATFLDIAFAASHLGAVFLPINYRLAREECRYILNNAGATRVFHDAELSSVAGDLPGAIEVSDAVARDSGALTGAARPIPGLVVRQPGDVFRLMYTSGTTDHPKGVVHTYSNFYWKSMDHVISLGLSAEDRLLVVGPLYHVGAFDLPGIAVLWLGGAMMVQRDFEPEAVLMAIQAERLTCAWFAPVMVGRLLACPTRDRYDLSSFRWCIGGGEKTPEARIRAFTGLFRNARYIDGFGLTESCSGDTLMEAGREIERIGSTGRALAHVEVTIRDHAGNLLPPGNDGEICLRGPKITPGYWRDPDKTARSFHGDVFRTGDVGHLDADGFLFITDRQKDMIISGGENIASSEVERVIYQLGEVSEAAVIGLPDSQWGERPVAIVVTRPGAALDLPTLQAHCAQHLAGFKVPKALFVREALPRNPSGKVLKRVLRDEYLWARGESATDGRAPWAGTW